MKILNLYCGIGGNRQLWGESHQITAVELDKDIANIYKSLYPNDLVIIGDAHEYLLKHYSEFDFIWSSPPCPTHSKMRISFKNQLDRVVYPDMSLYQEILLLKHFYNGLFCVENVNPYYETLIPATFKIDRHLFWSNFHVPNLVLPHRKSLEFCHLKNLQDINNIYVDLKHLEYYKALRIMRNCVKPSIGKHILDAANKKAMPTNNLTFQQELFN